MIYRDVAPGIFLARPNRFIAEVELGGKTEICHVKNTGRLGELLVPGARVLVQPAQNPARKTRYDLISVYKDDVLVNIDSSAPNRIFAEWLAQSGYLGGLSLLKPEQVFGASRFDFYAEAQSGRWFIEVKGVTLVEDGVALFPDAPTERGVKHLHELALCKSQGYKALAAFIIKRPDARYFAPNEKTHPAFGQALREAARQGVKLLALDCVVTENSVAARGEVGVIALRDVTR